MDTVISNEGRLSDVIIYEILLLLPVKSLVRLSCVNKSWRKLVTRNEVFVHSHLINQANTNKIEVLMYSNKNHGDDDEECFRNYDIPSADDRFMKPRKSAQLPNPLYIGRNFRFAGCCDGIVCCYKLVSRAIYLWNPALHQSRTILTKGQYNSIYYHDLVGFGYDPRSKDYKVVKMGSTELPKVELYSFKLNSWKLISIDSSYDYLNRDVRLESRNHPLSFKGWLHWIGEISIPEQDERGKDNVVIAFDISDEKLKFFEIPSSVVTSVASFACLGVLKGCLSFIATANYSEWEVWSMKVYGVPDSWMRATIIDLEPIDQSYPIGFSAKNEKVFILKEPHSVWSYDLDTRKRSHLFDLIGDRTMFDYYFMADYVESLISVVPSPPSEPSCQSDPSRPSEPTPAASLSEPLPSKLKKNMCSIYFAVLFVMLAILFCIFWLV